MECLAAFTQRKLCHLLIVAFMFRPMKTSFSGEGTVSSQALKRIKPSVPSPAIPANFKSALSTTRIVSALPRAKCFSRLPADSHKQEELTILPRVWKAKTKARTSAVFGPHQSLSVWMRRHRALQSSIRKRRSPGSNQICVSYFSLWAKRHQCLQGYWC